MGRGGRGWVSEGIGGKRGERRGEGEERLALRGREAAHLLSLAGLVDERECVVVRFTALRC